MPIYTNNLNVSGTIKNVPVILPMQLHAPASASNIPANEDVFTSGQYYVGYIASTSTTTSSTTSTN
jgi:hypothetical protein